MTGKQLRKARADAGLSLWELATALGVSESHLSNVERGRKPLPEELAVKATEAIAEIAERRAVHARKRKAALTGGN